MFPGGVAEWLKAGFPFCLRVFTELQNVMPTADLCPFGTSPVGMTEGTTIPHKAVGWPSG